jgi:hypothetical protein
MATCGTSSSFFLGTSCILETSGISAKLEVLACDGVAVPEKILTFDLVGSLIGYPIKWTGNSVVFLTVTVYLDRKTVNRIKINPMCELIYSFRNYELY